MKDGARSIQSIEVGGRILQALVDEARPMMLSEIAEAAGMKPAQCHAYMTSLKHIGLVHQNAHSGLYAVGHLALNLGMSWLDTDRQMSQAIEGLAAITEDVVATSILFVWGKQGPTVAHIDPGPRQASLSIRQGSLFSLVGTSAGRVFAAFLDTPEVHEMISAELAHVPKTRSLGEDLTAEELDRYIAEIRELGYSMVQGTPVPAVNTIAAPVLGPDGALTCVLSLVGATEDFPLDVEAEGVRRLLDLARGLSDQGDEQ